MIYKPLWTVLLVFLLFAPSVAAQTRDSDGDGVIDRQDRCVDEPGPASNDGCPLPQPPDDEGDEATSVPPPQPPPGDRDGDGTPDDQDECPDEGGPAQNNGCQPEPTPELSATGPCLLATRDVQRVNVRQWPSVDAPVVGTIEPSQALKLYALVEGETQSWYLTHLGFVAAWVVRTGGDCDTLPMLQSGDDSPDLPEDYPCTFEDGFSCDESVQIVQQSGVSGFPLPRVEQGIMILLPGTAEGFNPQPEPPARLGSTRQDACCWPVASTLEASQPWM